MKIVNRRTSLNKWLYSFAMPALWRSYPYVSLKTNSVRTSVHLKEADFKHLNHSQQFWKCSITNHALTTHGFLKDCIFFAPCKRSPVYLKAGSLLKFHCVLSTNLVQQQFTQLIKRIVLLPPIYKHINNRIIQVLFSKSKCQFPFYRVFCKHFWK